jgi:hypothetical protein
MFCKKCGAPNDDLATMCSRCGASLGGPVLTPGETVPNHLVWAILTTLFCCIPFGIVSIVYAAQVNAKLAGGDYRGAVDSSNNAKKWAIIAAVCGILPLFLYTLAMIASGQ